MFTDYTDDLNGKFINQIENLNGYNEFDFYIIINAFGSVMSGHSRLFDCWIYESNDRWCVGFWINGNYLLNSRNLTKKDINLINNKVNFSQFKINGFHFAGDTEIIEQLAQINLDFSLEPFKERYYYNLNYLKLKSKFTNEVSSVSRDDVPEIAVLYQQYFQEEYNGLNDKDLQSVEEKVESLRLRKSIFKLIINKKIIGFCSIMSFLNEEPNMIGTIFIDTNHRMNGNGKHLLSYVINKIYKPNNQIFLMTTKENLASNKMVKSVGFEKQYEHSDRLIKNYG